MSTNLGAIQFDQHWEPRSETLKSDIQEIIKRLNSYEQFYELRKRRRKKVDNQSFERIVTAIICALVHRELTEPGGWLSLSLSNRKELSDTKYSEFSLGYRLSYILKILASSEMGFLQLRLGAPRKSSDDGQLVEAGKLTTIRARDLLKKWIVDKRYLLGELKRSFTEEIIILKREKLGRYDKGARTLYDETPEIVEWRTELRQLNEWLGEADIQYFGPENVDINRRVLRRYFNNNSFEQGGRLFGAFWQDLKKLDCRQHLQIESETIADLDYSNSAIRLLYAMLGKPVHFEDAYTLPCFPAEMRDGVKAVINSALSSVKPQIRFPQGIKELFPKKTKYKTILKAVRQFHAPVADHFFCGIGIKLQFEESKLLMHALSILRENEIVALPMHDGVMTAYSKRERAKESLLIAFRDLWAVDCIVKQKFP